MVTTMTAKRVRWIGGAVALAAIAVGWWWSHPPLSGGWDAEIAHGTVIVSMTLREVDGTVMGYATWRLPSATYLMDVKGIRSGRHLALQFLDKSGENADSYQGRFTTPWVLDGRLESNSAKGQTGIDLRFEWK
jgi:hypothetical protein